MSNIKQLLFELMEEDHERALSTRERARKNLIDNGTLEPTEEEMAMARYDHARSDEVDSTAGQEVEDYE